MAIEDDLRGATVSMNRWRNGIADDGPSGAARAEHLHRCAELAATEIDRLRDLQADLTGAIEGALAFIADEYADAKSQALDGEHVSREARPVWNSLCEALANAQRHPDDYWRPADDAGTEGKEGVT